MARVLAAVVVAHGEPERDPAVVYAEEHGRDALAGDARGPVDGQEVTLTITSSPEGWSWSVARTEKWFSKAGSDLGTAPTLLAAIEGGLARAMGLLGEACSVRDSRRRAALDSSYAVDHPIQPANEGKDPIERLRPREPRKTKARTPPAVDAPLSLPDAPVTAHALQQMADEVTAEADALAAIRDVPWVWQESSAKDDAVHWFAQVGLDDVADEIQHYDGGPDRPLDTFLDFLRGHVTAHDLDAITQADALTQLARLHEGWKCRSSGKVITVSSAKVIATGSGNVITASSAKVIASARPR